MPPFDARKTPLDFDVDRIRADFPILRSRNRGKPLIYLDNAATTQKPEAVIQTMQRFYREQNANIHRGLYELSEQATEAYEAARGIVRDFLGAADAREIVFVRGATEGINLVAQTFGRANVKAGDEVLITAMEHHSNIVPWQLLCQERGASLKVVPISNDGELVLDEFARWLSPRTRIVAVTQVSNALGTINPIREIVELAHGQGAKVLVDGAQAAPHLPIDVRDLDCDFYVLSGHKVFGPTGIGVLYGKAEVLEAMPPWQGGGDMILSVSFDKTTYNRLPYKFEAGTPHIAGAIGMGAAITYLHEIGMPAIAAYEHDLTDYGTKVLGDIPGLSLVGTARHKVGVLSFVLEGVHPHDIGTIVDREGIAIRAGHHCAQPIMQRFGIPATARASLAFYNTRAELDSLAMALVKVQQVFGQ
ncbi:MAG: cysteine desulfurase [Cyanobacteria bacterium REEB65]|nr:cysteine desulfurase [Cyanobacteria bacterium REEB65]